MARKTENIAGRRQSWIEAGDGEAVVLVHGIGSDASVWSDQIDHLEGAARFYAWDLPGYGESENLDADAPAAADYAEALAAFLDARGIRRAHLVGHSLGAIILLALLDRWSGEAMSLTLLSPAPGMGHLEPERREAIRQARRAEVQSLGMKEFSARRGPEVLAGGASPEAARQHTAIMTGIDERAYLQAFEMMCATSVYSLTRKVSAPARVIRGAEDAVSPEDPCNRIAAELGTTLVTLDGVGHVPVLEAPETVTEVLRSVLHRTTA